MAERLAPRADPDPVLVVDRHPAVIRLEFLRLQERLDLITDSRRLPCPDPGAHDPADCLLTGNVVGADIRSEQRQEVGFVGYDRGWPRLEEGPLRLSSRLYYFQLATRNHRV